MLSQYEKVKLGLKTYPTTWLVTGVAGFIGSNLLEALLKLDQRVIGLDNFSTGYQRNLDEVRSLVTLDQWNLFTFIEGDIRSVDVCQGACKGVDYVLHQAALGSVPRSINDPIAANQSNVDGFLNMLVAARDNKVKTFVFAASSSTYGDDPDLPKVEEKIGRPLSPYAVTKLVNELYADVFSRTYGLRTIGLRYFNVFGARQDPDGAYAAVIPKWVAAMIDGANIQINGDGSTSRDFCYISNTVQANLLAACAGNDSGNDVYNIAFGESTDLNQLFLFIKEELSDASILYEKVPINSDFRSGDVLHSLAAIKKARQHIGYDPEHSLRDGLAICLEWYIKNHDRRKSS